MNFSFTRESARGDSSCCARMWLATLAGVAVKPVGVGVVGCGMVSEPYFKNLKASPRMSVVACADQAIERARDRAQEFGVPRACSTEELLADPDVEMVINLTIPTAHAGISLAALAAGKHVYTEKPLATTREDASRILEAAAAGGLTVASAPDTVLGAGIQTCLRLLEQGDLGEPLAGAGFMFGAGPENFHANPAFFYEPGGGPLLDVGPYYVTTLICLFGAVRRVTGMARVLYRERTPDRGPRKGETFKVSTPTWIAAVIEFESGAQANLITTFGISGTDLPNLQVYGTKGILGVPDPNTFGGPVRLRLTGEQAWREVPLLYNHTDASNNSRALGAIEAALAFRDGQQPRLSGQLAYHALDVMLSILESAASGRHVEVSSRCSRPALLPLDTALVAAT
jgi:predicted dehydrogenase